MREQARLRKLYEKQRAAREAADPDAAAARARRKLERKLELAAAQQRKLKCAAAQRRKQLRRRRVAKEMRREAESRAQVKAEYKRRAALLSETRKERMRRCMLFEDFLMHEHRLSREAAHRFCDEARYQLFGQVLYHSSALPDEYVAADGAQRRADLLQATVDAMAVDRRANYLEQLMRGRELPEALAARVKDAPLIAQIIAFRAEATRRSSETATLRNLALAEQAKRRCLAECESDARIDRDHSASSFCAGRWP